MSVSLVWNFQKNMKYSSLINSGKTIRGVAGFPEVIFPQLVGKTIAFATQCEHFEFTYTVEVDSIEERKNQYTLHGKFNLPIGTIITSHSVGCKCVFMCWIIE